jgi:predicted DNA binding CopG/RHH family protein
VISIISARAAMISENNITESEVGRIMKAEYDFSNARKNLYTKKMKKQITINIDSNTIDYFKGQSELSGIPYQTLINLYLSDCAIQKKQLKTSWQ